MDSSKNSFSGAGFDEHHEHGGSHPDENECTTFSYQEWFRLRDFWNSISSLQNMIPISSVQLENCISEEDSYRDYASQIQNLQIRLKILEQKASTAREIILTSRCRINSLEAEIQKSHQEKQQAISRETNQQEEIALGQKQNSEKRIVLQRLHNEMIFRRRFMFKELNEIFFPPKPPIFNKNCHCQKFDLIRCLHFPTVAARLGHNDSEISAAAALLVQLINSASLVLSHPLKHVLLFNGSRSLLVIRKNSESFNLFASASSSKSNRDRFDHALYLLCEVALQFRADCGVSAREMDRPIRLFRDLLRSFGSHKFVHTEILFRHSKSSYLSPSNYVSIEKEETAKITDKSVDANPLLRNLLPSLPTIY